MLTLERALSWSVDSLQQAAFQFQTMAADLGYACDTMQSATTSVDSAWSDSAGDLACSTMRRWTRDVDAYSERLNDAYTRLQRYASQMSEAQSTLRHTVNAARSAGYHVSGEGLVTPPVNPAHNTPGKAGQEFPLYVPGAVNQAVTIEATIQQEISRMSATDATIAGLFNNLTMASTDVEFAGHSSAVELPLVPEQMGAKEAGHWWKGLSHAQREALLTFGLSSLYGIQGLPATVEDQVNRWRLEQETTLTATMLADAEGAGDPSVTYWRNAHNTCVTTQTYLDDWTSRVGSINAAAFPVGTPLLLLGFTSLANGGQGSSILAIGNPDTAAHVSGYIEGVGSRPTDMPFDNATPILQTEDGLVGNPRQDAIVMYQCGPMPPTVEAAADQIDARTYAGAYRNAINAVIDSHQAVSGAAANYTMFAHSYGTEVLTRAAANHGLSRVNDMVMLASPGVNADSTGAYGINPHHVYAATSLDDPIRYAASPTGLRADSIFNTINRSGGTVHDPTTFAHTFPVDDSGGHSSYFQSGKDLGELARLAEGLSP